MNKDILLTESQNFINTHLNQNITTTVLRGSPFKNIRIQELADQIVAKKKCESKLPTWFNTPAIYYPPPLSIEQASSEITAAYKASLVAPGTLADLTGGMGVDSYFFAKKNIDTSYFEIQKEVFEIAQHNFKVLGVPVKCYHADGINTIQSDFYDTIYLDPSRRNTRKGKVFLLQDAQPDVIAHQNYLLERCQTLLIKVAPLLDISAIIQQLPGIHRIHILAVHNEVKELLLEFNQEATEDLQIKTVNFKSQQTESFDFFWRQPSTATYALPKNYLYEPHAALMKSGGFNQISAHFKIDKLHPNSHLYTSDQPIAFPGRIFNILQVVSYHKKEMKALQGSNAHVTVRNFPLSVDAIKKQWKIKDGGDLYYFFTTLANQQKAVLICKKMN